MTAAGSNVTKLFWPLANGGFNITATNSKNVFHISDVSLTTTQVGSGVALNFIGIGSNNGQFFQSDLHNVQISGDDIGPSLTSQYWSVAIRIITGVRWTFRTPTLSDLMEFRAARAVASA